MSSTMNRMQWTRLNVFLHWLIVLLVLAQLAENEFMNHYWDALQDGTSAGSLTKSLAWTHVVAGVLILIAALIRIGDRFIAGRPAYADKTPKWAVAVSKLTHWLLFAILLAMPSLGLLAWLTGNDQYAQYHTFLWTPLLILIAIHILGALAEHFVFHTDALRRMRPMTGRR